MASRGMRCYMEQAVVEDISLRKREISDRTTTEAQEEVSNEEVLHTEWCPMGCYKVVSRFFLKSA